MAPGTAPWARCSPSGRSGGSSSAPCWPGLLSRAQDAGLARADVTAEDLTVALLGVARTMGITSQNCPNHWRRHLAIVLDGLKAQHIHRLPGLPPTPEQLDRDLGEWSCELLGGRAVRPAP